MTLPTPASAIRPSQPANLADLAAIPEEEIWLASQKSARTRRAYKQDVAHFMHTLGITTTGQLRQVDHRAVIAWKRIMREEEGAAASTVRRRLAALSSLFKHLVRHGAASRNPVVDVARPSINREEGTTAAFSKAQARKLLDAPSPDTPADLRDRTILSVGLPLGLRRVEITALTVGDLHQTRGSAALRVIRKGDRRDTPLINPQSAGGTFDYWCGPDIARVGTGHYSGLSGAMPKHTAYAGEWSRTRRPGGAEHVAGDRAGAKLFDALTSGYVHHHGAGNGHNWITCKRQPGIVTFARRSCKVGKIYNPRKTASLFAIY